MVRRPMHHSTRTPALVISFAFSLGLVTNTALAQQPSDVPVVQPSVETPVPNPPPTVSPLPVPDAAPPPALPPPTNPVTAPPMVSPTNVLPVPASPASAPQKLLPKLTFPSRSLRIGPSMQVLLYEPFPYEKLSRVGTGVFGAYEFFLKPSFVIGINLSYRYFPGEAHLHQVGYGLLLKHYLAGMDSQDSTFMPYVEYGLLLQINKISTRKGTGTAHDTRLSAGTDFRIAKKIFFVEASYHYSRLGLFEQTSERLDNVEFDVGYRYPW